MLDEATKMKRRTFCERCGSCCIKGGPALHVEDMRQIEDGVLTYKHMITFRSGEMVNEVVKEGVVPLEDELVKLRGIGENHWACLMYDDDEKSCTIYDTRPVECSVFNCWAPEDLAAMYEKDRLSRKDIIPKGSALMELIEMHESEVPYAKIAEHAKNYFDGDEKAADALVDRVVWDAAFRSTFVEKAGAGDEETNFLFGRPLSKTIRQYGLEVVKSADGYEVKKLD